MKMKEMQSVIVAKVTFFNDGINPLRPPEINWRAGSAHTRFLCSQGVGVLPMGTTGESPAVTQNQHIKLIEETKIVADETDKKTFVLAGTGSNSTWEAAGYTQLAEKRKCDAALLVGPYYNKPASEQSFYEYFMLIAKAFPDMPIIPYLISGRTGSVFAPADLAVLADKCPNVIAVKYAEPKLDNAVKIRLLLPDPEKFKILSGDDNRTVKMMTDPHIKACGVVSVMANIVPAAIKKMCDLILAGKDKQAKAIEKKLKPLFGVVGVGAVRSIKVPSGDKIEYLDKYPNPASVKTIMSGLGMQACHCAPPLGKMDKIAVQMVRYAVRQVWKSFPEAFQPLAEFYNLDIGERLADNEVWKNLAYTE